MQIVERTFSSTQPMPQSKESTTGVGEQDQAAIHVGGERPKTVVGEFARLTRLPAAVAMTMPAACGAALGWWQTGSLNWLALAYMLAGVLSMVIGFNLRGDYYDYQSRDEVDLHAAPEPYFSGYSFLLHGVITPKAIRLIALVLLFLSLLCNLLLVWLVDWPMLFFAGLSYLLGFTYMSPPVKYAFRGWGSGGVRRSAQRRRLGDRRVLLTGGDHFLAVRPGRPSPLVCWPWRLSTILMLSITGETGSAASEP